MPRRHVINTTIENQLVLINSASSVPVHAKELHPGFWKQLQLFCSEFMRNALLQFAGPIDMRLWYLLLPKLIRLNNAKVTPYFYQKYLIRHTLYLYLTLYFIK